MDISIRGRLAYGFGTVFVLVAIGLLVSLVQTKHLNQLEQRRNQEITPAVKAVDDLTRAYLLQGVALRSYELTGADDERGRFQQASENGRLARARLGELPRDPATEPLLDQVAVASEEYDAAAARLLRLIDAGEATGDDRLRKAELQLASIRGKLLDGLARFERVQLDADRSAGADAIAARARLVDGLLLIGLLVFGAGGLSALLTTNAVRRPAARLLSAARALSNGDYAPARALARPTGARDRFRDELRELAAAFGEMACALERRESQITASAEVSGELATSIDPKRLASGALAVLTRAVRCPLGVVYLARGKQLVPLAQHAGSDRIGSLALNEGIPGQAAMSGRTLTIADLPSDTPFRLHVGFEEVVPRTLLAVPMRFEERLLGVVLLASLAPLDGETVAFVEQAAQQLGVSLRNAITHEEVQRLAHELEARNEELRAHNEEIQAQNEEIQAQNEEIQSLSEEIRAQNEQLKQHNDELTETDRQKDELLSVASHELRTPLSALTMTAQLLHRRCARKEPLHADALCTDVDRICRQVKRLNGQVERLLDFTRARMGRLELRPATLDLRAVLQELVGELALRSPDRRVKLVVDDEALQGEWDRGYLEQVFMNLLENAIRYSPGGGEVEVRARVVDGEVRVAVRDEGIGIPEAAMARLFEPYFRHAEARRVTQSGMGIGLYVTRQIVTAHGGRLWAESQLGRGSTFTVALPRVAPRASAARRSVTDAAVSVA